MSTRTLVKDLMVGTSARCRVHTTTPLRKDQDVCNLCESFVAALKEKFPIKAKALRSCTFSGWSIKEGEIYDVFGIVQSSNIKHNAYGCRGWLLYTKSDDKDSPVAGELFPFDALEIYDGEID